MREDRMADTSLETNMYVREATLSTNVTTLNDSYPPQPDPEEDWLLNAHVDQQDTNPELQAAEAARIERTEPSPKMREDRMADTSLETNIYVREATLSTNVTTLNDSYSPQPDPGEDWLLNAHVDQQDTNPELQATEAAHFERTEPSPKMRKDRMADTSLETNIYLREATFRTNFTTLNDSYSPQPDPEEDWLLNAHVDQQDTNPELQATEAADIERAEHGYYEVAYGIRTPRYQTMKARVDSFINYPQSIDISHHQLAVAGFYFTGYGNQCRCFACDGGFEDLHSDYDLFEAHENYFPDCPYMKHLHGIEDLQQIGWTIAEVNTARAELERRGNKFPSAEQIANTILDTTPRAALSENKSDKKDYKKVLRKNKTKLVDKLSPDVLLKEFLTCNYFTRLEYRQIKDLSLPSEKNKAILDKVMTKGDQEYNMFKTCLRRAYQGRLADFLESQERRMSTSSLN
ncbi:baculoviral IAP repeat-containing protein 2-like isoform X1 [Mercenaria mercenaria]|uniref:baculoviral IAP repeat-containing protein 2-like isoform X1 n=1 Tax=Mercenaria mercenaria TaxID=6596 RepID=UPI00234F58AD|nr:baculoviral IAP repeat-containing protein 2-like isoform X1 [Mercenaria mercenaria]